MKKYLYLLGLCCLLAVAMLANCSRQTEPQLDSKDSRAYYGMQGTRTNPLQTYIRDYWTNGDEDHTGGLHYDHIKIYGHVYSNLDGWGTDQQQFIVDHFDMYCWGGPYVGEIADDDFLWIFQVETMGNAKIGSIYLNDWLRDNGYTFDDVVMHYKYNTDNYYAPLIPGWNPDDDWDGDGCIEPDEGCDGNPCYPNRSAQCDTLARLGGVGNNYAARFHDPNPDSPPPAPYHSYLIDRTKYQLDDPTHPGVSYVDGVHFDCVCTNPGPVGAGALLVLDSTFTHEGEDVQAEDFRYIVDKYEAVGYTIAEVENDLGTGVICLSNTVNTWYNCGPLHGGYTQKYASLDYLDNIFNETWMYTNKGGSGDNPSFNAEKIERNLECPFETYLESGKGYIFTCFDEGDEQGNYTGSDRGRGFSLATFYMINHQMAFYYYRTKDHSIGPSNPPVWTMQWNPLVEFNVGQPTTNSVRKPDFQGNMNTDLFFVWVDHQDYKILGREFLRDDGWRVLVLTKIVADSPAYPKTGNEGEDPTCHRLPPRSWLRLMPDMTWSEPITQIVLTNNEGAILLKQKIGEDPPHPQQQ